MLQEPLDHPDSLCSTLLLICINNLALLRSRQVLCVRAQRQFVRPESRKLEIVSHRVTTKEAPYLFHRRMSKLCPGKTPRRTTNCRDRCPARPMAFAGQLPRRPLVPSREILARDTRLKSA